MTKKCKPAWGREEEWERNCPELQVKNEWGSAGGRKRK